MRCVLAGLLAFTSAAPALAHHPGPTSVTPRSRAGLEVAAAEFDLGRRGSFWLGSLELEHAFFERVSLGASIRVAHVRYADGERATGPADVETHLRGLLYKTEHGTCAFGAAFGVELPTGDEEEGLGGGHVMLSPELAAHFRPLEPLIVHATVRGHFAVSPGHEHDGVIGSVIAPHEAHELYFGTALGGFWEPLYVMGGAEIGLLPDEPDLGPVLLHAQVGVIEADQVQVSLRFEVPVAGPERLEWLARLGVDYLF